MDPFLSMYGYDSPLDEHNDFHYSTDAEWDRAEAYERGEANPDQAWINTSRDAWHANPFYQGPPVPHPEDYDEEWIDLPEEPQDKPVAASAAMEWEEDIPF